jgi:hypothetical protein
MTKICEPKEQLTLAELPDIESSNKTDRKRAKNGEVWNIPKITSKSSIIHSIENFIRYNFSDTNPSITFTSKNPNLTIDLSECTIIEEFGELINDNLHAIIDYGIDCILHKISDSSFLGLLHLAKSDKLLEIMRDKLIQELHLPHRDELDIGKTLDVILDYFDNIQLKAFNICFPHAVRELEHGKEMVIYLSHVVKYQDQVLDSIIECQLNLDEILDIYRNDVIESYEKDSENRIYLKSLNYSDEELLNKDIQRKTTVRQIVKDINSISRLYHTITDLNKTNEELLRYLRDYKQLISNTKEFQKSLQNFIDLNEKNMKTLILTLIKASKYVRENYRLNQPNEAHREIISYMHSQIKFQFDSALISAIQQFTCMITFDDSLINEIANKYEDKWKNIINAGIRNPFDIKIYDKVGKIAQYPLTKKYRIALGFFVMKYVLLKIEVARNTKKKNLTINVI